MVRYARRECSSLEWWRLKQICMRTLACMSVSTYAASETIERDKRPNV